MSNTVYRALVVFDKLRPGMSVHRRLREYVSLYGTYQLDYYLAKLSHEIYKSKGVRGHAARQRVRDNLKHYVLGGDS